MCIRDRVLPACFGQQGERQRIPDLCRESLFEQLHESHAQVDQPGEGWAPASVRATGLFIQLPNGPVTAGGTVGVPVLQELIVQPWDIEIHESVHRVAQHRGEVGESDAGPSVPRLVGTGTAEDVEDPHGRRDGSQRVGSACCVEHDGQDIAVRGVGRPGGPPSLWARQSPNVGSTRVQRQSPPGRRVVQRVQGNLPQPFHRVEMRSDGASVDAHRLSIMGRRGQVVHVRHEPRHGQSVACPLACLQGQLALGNSLKSRPCRFRVGARG